MKQLKIDDYYLKKHPYKISKGYDGCWCTYLPNNGQRKTIKKREKEDVEQIVIAYWREQYENPIIKDLISNWLKEKMEYKDATTLIDSQIHESLVQSQMGHKDISTTRKFYYFNRDDMDEQREQLEKALR